MSGVFIKIMVICENTGTQGQFYVMTKAGQSIQL